MKRIILLIALIVITNLPISCGLGCGPFENYKYSIVSISSEIGSVVDNLFSKHLSSNIDTAVIQFRIDETHRTILSLRSSSSLVNAAFACSPPEPKIPKLMHIKIVSDKSISSGGVEFMAGENLERIFRIFDSQFGQRVEMFNLIAEELHFFSGFEGQTIMFKFESKLKNPISQEFNSPSLLMMG